MSDHARLTPSGSARWMVCPGSVREEARYPRKSGPAAIDGTHTHTGLEHCVDKQLPVADSIIGQTFEDHEGKFTVDVDRASRITVALKYIWERQAEMKPCAVRSEEKVNAGNMINRDDIYGTADVQLISNDTLEVIDYKDGMTPVDPVENSQLSIYAAGAMMDYRTPEGTYPFTKIRLTIIQPKLTIKNMNPIRHWDTDVNYIHQFMGRVVNAARATDYPDAPLVAGDVQCKWCDHKGNCPEFANFNMENVSLMFNDVAKQAADKEPTELTDEQIAEIVESASSVRAMLEAVEKEALRRFESGHAIAGLKAIRGRGSRSWNLSEDDMADKLKRMGVPKAEMFVTKLVSPAQAEKLKWTKKSKGEDVVKSLSERQLKTLEQEYIKKSVGGLKIVPEAADGDPVLMDASPMFENKTQVEIPDWMK